MLDLFFWISVFIIALAVLIKASDLFTDSAEKIGLAFGLPSFIVGVTIVAFGTSLPELISAIFSFSQNLSEIVVGNVVGANIANIFLILGLSAIISKRIKVSREILGVDLPMMVASALLFAMVVFDGFINLVESLLLIALFVIYIVYIIMDEKRSKGRELKKEVKKIRKELHIIKRISFVTCFKSVSLKDWVFLVLSVVLIYFSARLTIDSIIKFSELFLVGKDIIAASIFSIGTTLPEMMVSVVAAKKGLPEIAVGNIIGSNIFNALAVLGFPALFGAFILQKTSFALIVNPFMIGFFIVATVLFFFITQDREITKWEGFLLIIFYLFFLVSLFGL
jgi:cation:H+ antiporter